MSFIQKHRVLIELSGLFLILLSVAWEVFLEGTVEDILLGEKFAAVNSELMLIWRGLASDNPGLFVHDNFGQFFEEYDRGNNSRHDQDWVTQVRFWIFCVGSVLLILGRFFELNRRNS